MKLKGENSDATLHTALLGLQYWALALQTEAQLISYWTELWTRASSHELFVITLTDFKTKICKWCTMKQITQWGAHEKSANCNSGHQELDNFLELLTDLSSAMVEVHCTDENCT